MAKMNQMKNAVNQQAETRLTEEEIRYILHAADGIIARAGRTMLAKILKGSRDKKLLDLELNDNISYGYYRSSTLAQITERVDWMIKSDFLEVMYDRDMPLLKFTNKGWIIQRDQLTNLLLLQWNAWVMEGTLDKDMSYLKDRNRGMILLFLQKVAATLDERFIPLLRRWELIEYQKVKKAIRDVIAHIRSKTENKLVLEGAPQEECSSEWLLAQSREAERLKCWECGDRFLWTIEEQDAFRLRGWDPPKRCLSCRDERKRGLQ